MDYTVYVQLVGFAAFGLLAVLGIMFGIPRFMDFWADLQGKYECNIYRRIGENYIRIKRLRVKRNLTEFKNGENTYTLNFSKATKFRGKIAIFDFNEDNALPLATSEVQLKVKDESKFVSPLMLQRYLKNKVLASILQGSKLTTYTLIIMMLGICLAITLVYLIYNMQTYQGQIAALNTQINDLLRQIAALGGTIKK